MGVFDFRIIGRYPAFTTFRDYYFLDRHNRRVLNQRSTLEKIFSYGHDHFFKTDEEVMKTPS